MTKRWMALLLGALMMLAACGATAEAPVPMKDAATLPVPGNASVTAKPDIVTITANAGVTGNTMLAAQEQVSNVIAGATQKLLELGVLESDIVTTNYSYYPEYNYEDTGRRLTGYQAGHTLEITCRDIDMLDSVIAAVTDSGMSEIYNVSYGLSSRSELYSEALTLAIQSAENKALTMAAASGKTITGLVSVKENNSYDYDARYAVTSSAKGAAMDAAVEEALSPGIRSGSVSVSASVTAMYAAGE